MGLMYRPMSSIGTIMNSIDTRPPMLIHEKTLNFRYVIFIKLHSFSRKAHLKIFKMSNAHIVPNCIHAKN